MKAPKDHTTTTGTKQVKEGPRKRRTKGDSQIGTNCYAHGSLDEFNHVVKPFLNDLLTDKGSLEFKILIGISYLEAPTLADLKLNGHMTQSIFNSALNLIKKGHVFKIGGRYTLTDQGINIITPFIQKYRIHAVA